MKALRVVLLAVAVLLVGVEPHSARAAGQCLSIVGSNALPARVGVALNLSSSCCSTVPVLPYFGWLLAGLLLAAGLLTVRRMTRLASGALLLCLVGLVGFFARPARGNACGGGLQWQAQSASETFTGSSASFSFTPTAPGIFVVSLSSASESATPVVLEVLPPCTGLCLQQVSCSGHGDTTISGTVYAPNGTLPIYDALVYVPNSPVAAFAPGVACEQCGTVSGAPLVQEQTASDGTFTIHNMPVGSNIPLVIQIGRWRRQVTIPTVTACTNTPLAAAITRLPRNRSEGDIPRVALVTGAADNLECVLRKIGIDDSQFGDPTSAAPIRFYKGTTPGARISSSTPTESTLWSSQSVVNQNDMVLLACQGQQNLPQTAARDALVNFVNAGGRVFATHFSYVWFNSGAFASTANWNADPSEVRHFATDPALGTINTTFPEGAALAQWLTTVGGSLVAGQVQVGGLRNDFTGVSFASRLWLNDTDSTLGTVPLSYTFAAPLSASTQCGRVRFDDYHAETATGSNSVQFPTECTTSAMSSAEKLLTFQLFHLASCVGPSGT